MRSASLLALALFLLPASVVAQQPSPATAPAPPSSSSGQAQKFFGAVHVGGQSASSSLRDTFTFTIYDETATVIDDQEYGGGFLFNVEGGYIFMPRWAAGMAISHVSGDTDARLSATVPHPQLFDTPRLATIDVHDTTHSESGYHFFVAYLYSIKPGIELRAFAGPSILHVTHDLPILTGNDISETPPFTSVTLTGAAIDERSKTVAAFHAGVGATYALTDRLGVDGFFRFARRTTEIPAVVNGNVDLTVGGAQFGIGVRVGF